MKIVKTKWSLILAMTMGISTAGFSQTNIATDTAFILKNVNDNKMEMALSQLGSDKGDSQVRKIARQMLYDHGKMLNDLADVAKKKNMKVDIDGSSTAAAFAPTGADNTAPAISNTTTSTDSSAATASNGTSTGSGTTGTTGSAGTSSNTSTQPATGMISLDDLANAKGADFSRMWIQHMTMMHQTKLAELQAAAKTVTDPDLLAAINKAIPKVQAHLTMLTNAGGNMNMKH